MGEMPPVPVVLEEGERVVRRVDGVRLFCVMSPEREGFLLLTDRRLIFNGRWKTTGGETLPLAYEGSLGDIVGCNVWRFPWKRLSVTFRQVLFKHGTEVVKLWENGEVRTSLDKLLDEVSIKPGQDLTVGDFRIIIIAQMALEGVEGYVDKDQPWLRPRPTKLVLVFRDIKQREALRSEIVGQIERYRRTQQPTPTNPCPVCRSPLTFIEQYQRWYCYNCQKYA